ncbi:TniQ family protein [Sphingobium yanoikuyae]|uniref:TniQ family protein n=1 Tax=Sphingobium yanoikuyae TaxID=13690 RepID=UPI003F0531CC
MNNTIKGSWTLSDAVTRSPKSVELRDQETAESILWRLAVANGERTVRRLFAATPNLSSQRDYGNDMAYRYVPIAARLAGIEESVLSQQSLIKGGRSSILRSQEFRILPAISRDRVCLGCLRDDQDRFDGQEEARPYRRNWWSLQQINTCPEHRLRLLDACPNCGSALRPLGAPMRCSCNPHYDLRRVSQTGLTEDQVAHDKWLLGRLGIGSGITRPILDDLSPDAGSRLCLLIGLSAIDPDKIAIRNITSDHAYAASTAGWAALDDWPHNLNKLLDKLVDSSPKYSHGGRGGYYEPLNKYLIVASPVNDFNFVHELIRNHAANRLSVTSRTSILGKPVKRGKFSTLQTVIDKVSVGYPTTVAVCNDLAIALDDANPRSSLVSRRDAERIQNYIGECVPRSALVSLLRCPRGIVSQLLENDTFRVRLRTENDILLWRQEIDQLTDLFNLPVRAPNSTEVSITHVLYALPYEWHTLMKAALNGLLSPVAISKSDGAWMDFIFNFEDAKSASYPATGMVSTVSALEEHGWEAGTIAHLRKHGFVNDSMSKRYVAPQVLDSFLVGHISMKEILRRTGWVQSARTVRSQLEKMGIRPVIPRVGKVSAFWRREAVESALGLTTCLP